MKRYLTDYFSVYKAELPGIKETIKLPANVWFRDDGEVFSLIENEVRTELIIHGLLIPAESFLEKVLNWPFQKIAIKTALDKVELKEKLIFDDLIGLCNPHKINEKTRAYVVAVKQGLDKGRAIFAKGHESGEFLNKINYQHILQDALDKEGISLDVKKYQGEDFADIAGLLALFKALRAGEKEIVLPVFKNRTQILQVLTEPFGFYTTSL